MAVNERERLILERLRVAYERDGWEFFIEPPGEILPPLLAGYRPDAVALRGQEGVIIEVTRRRDRSAGEQVARLSETLRTQPGWTLNVYFDEAVNPGEYLPVPAHDDLLEQIVAAGQLIDQGHLRPALLHAWAVLEGTVRRVGSKRRGIRRAPVGALQSVEYLDAHGFINPETADRLRGLAQLRNAVAHGDFTVSVTSEDVRAVLAVVERLISGPFEAAA